MSPNPNDLWPAEIVVEPLTPVEILKQQGQILHDRTGGRLHAEVVTTDEFRKHLGGGDKHYLLHRFEIVAPALRYRHQLFVCEHDRELVYPVEVDWTDGLTDAQFASDQAEFEKTVGKCLTSRRTVAVLQSLLARIRETNQPVSV